MIYELRFYEIQPGKMAAFEGRQGVAVRLLEKHGAKVVGCWTEDVGTSNQVVYLIGFEDAAHRDKTWAAFGGEPDWQKAFAESEKGGPVTVRLSNRLLRPTNYSPMK